MGRHKQISCEICSKVMRCDHMKRHMKVHVDLSSEDPEQMCKSILEDIVDDILNRKTSKADSIISSEKPKVNDLHSDGLDETHKPLTVDVDTMQFENVILYDNHINGNLT